MSVTVRLATVLADMVGGRNRFELEGATVEAVLRALAGLHPALETVLWREGGEFNPILFLLRNNEGLTGGDPLATPLEPGDELSVISSLEGG